MLLLAGSPQVPCARIGPLQFGPSFATSVQSWNANNSPITTHSLSPYDVHVTWTYKVDSLKINMKLGKSYDRPNITRHITRKQAHCEMFSIFTKMFGYISSDSNEHRRGAVPSWCEIQSLPKREEISFGKARWTSSPHHTIVHYKYEILLLLNIISALMKYHFEHLRENPESKYVSENCSESICWM